MAAPLLPIVPSGSLLPALSRQKWDQTTTPLRLPRGFRLVLADVDAGTDTPSFVNKVLWWRVEQADEAGEIWKRLDKANSLLGEHLREMCQLENEEGYDAFVAESAKVDMEHVSGRGREQTPFPLPLVSSLGRNGPIWRLQLRSPD